MGIRDEADVIERIGCQSDMIDPHFFVNVSVKFTVWGSPRCGLHVLNTIRNRYRESVHPFRHSKK